MDKVLFEQRMNPLLERYRVAVRCHCYRTADARVRDMAKIFADYRGISYEEAHNHLVDMLVKKIK